MMSKEKQEILDKIEHQFYLLRDQDGVYQIFKDLLKHFPNDSELGQAIRLLFTLNIK